MEVGRVRHRGRVPNEKPLHFLLTNQTRGIMKRQLNGLKDRPASLKRPPRDPDVEAVVKILEGKDTHEIWMNSWVSKSTIRRLRNMQTRHPQHGTLQTCAGAVGYEYVLRRKR
jgi:hypothetical protein